MKYVVKKGYSYTDTKGRGKIYGPGEVFDGDLDSVQKWKVGQIDQAPEVPIVTKEVYATQTKKAEAATKKVKVDPDYDEMDEGEET